MRVSGLALLSALVLVLPAGRLLAQSTPPGDNSARVGQLSPDEARRAERARQRAVQRAANRAPHRAAETKTDKAAPSEPKLKTAERPASDETVKHRHTVRRTTGVTTAEASEEHTSTRHQRRYSETSRRAAQTAEAERAPRVGDRVPDGVPLYDLPPRAEPRPGFGIMLGFGRYAEPEEAEVEPLPPRHNPRFDDGDGDEDGYR